MRRLSPVACGVRADARAAASAALAASPAACAPGGCIVTAPSFRNCPMPKTTFAPFAAMLGGLATVLTLAACAGNGQTPAAPGAAAAAAAAAGPGGAGGGGVCNGERGEVVVGQSSTASVVESARARSGARMARILRPGQTITKEFNAQRLSLQVDGN